LNFTQDTGGFDTLITAMDEANVDKAVIFGMPMNKQWDEHIIEPPRYYMSDDSRTYYCGATDYIMLNDLQKMDSATKGRFYPFVCGVNPNDKYASKYLKHLIESYSGSLTIFGIGEIMSRHDALTALTYGEPPRANHPALIGDNGTQPTFQGIYELAKNLKMPVLLHHNISSHDLPPKYEKEDEWGEYTLTYLNEMDEILARYDDINIIWAHVGISNHVKVKALHNVVREQLKKKSSVNLYYDISWVVYDAHIAPNLREWKHLITDFPDKFIIGSDIVPKTNYDNKDEFDSWDGYAMEIIKYYDLLDTLDKRTSHMVCRGNVLKLLGVDDTE
jgi:predicted TIM-barrel fold metal-dependent hydrolase